jgi:hypothetical protein
LAKPDPGALAAAVAEVAAAIGAERTDVAGGVSYSVGKMVIVVVEGTTASFWLRADIAAAAARTPDAAPSSRGPDWVAFSPTTLDRFTRDRIESWFEFAANHVTGGRRDS